MLVEDEKSDNKRKQRNSQSVKEMIPVPHRTVKNAGAEHFKYAIQRIKHKNFHYN